MGRGTPFFDPETISKAYTDTRLRDDGMPLGQIKHLLGHTSTAMSAKFAHLENQGVADEARQWMQRWTNR
ncbi:hypothetical protein U879_16500 [Defluviimonas sp. 20V17]|uniref:Uncharacterized protein n=1 Tax=Allgaiera indica TaxID=765699 RepID=A0AAN4UR99_9RHOB|nr:hypothetical protein [Allgaiera indica]KDB02581.1 hypothetical protein U879_16500 [Defluviimonas sp. 20V17]GHE01664.1 hypothetical protein GCM10008024_17910 [Allgaiera indica]SDW96953.1 hypothetical protein SAMN05444006_108159 [Allgaiera indica]